MVCRYSNYNQRTREMKQKMKLSNIALEEILGNARTQNRLVYTVHAHVHVNNPI